MGILSLMTLLKAKAPNCIKHLSLDSYQGKTIGCDASMAMYQFLIQTQRVKDEAIAEFTDKDGNRTGHLLGLFNRTIQFIENGILPVWVFDGKPPLLKYGEIARRRQSKEEARVKSVEAIECGDMREALLQNQRTTSISSGMREDAIQMLRLMGCPIIQAPGEAEAQCASMCRSGLIYATATEDMDALTFQTPILLRGFNIKKEPVIEINHEKMLQELNLSYPQFVDLCILCGCDYTEKIEGIAQATAFKMITQHRDIESILIHIQAQIKQKYIVPESFNYIESRELFMNPEVTDPATLCFEWNDLQEEALKTFLVHQKGFYDVRIDNGLERIKSKRSPVSEQPKKKRSAKL